MVPALFDYQGTLTGSQKMRTTQGTGKHGHKTTKQSYAHHEAPSARGHGEQGRTTLQSRSRERESSDLKSREYRDAQGNIHHHTRTSQTMKGKT
jgi:hypothetical protein